LNASNLIFGTCAADPFVLGPNAEYSVYAAPSIPPGYSAGDQTIAPVGVSDDGGVVVALRMLNSIGGRADGVVVWKHGSARPALLLPDAHPELSNPSPLGISRDGSTIVGVAQGPMGWLLKL
jgi:hypothetical protein